MELGGPDYARAAPKVQDSQGFEVQGATGKGAGYRCAGFAAGTAYQHCSGRAAPCSLRVRCTELPADAAERQCQCGRLHPLSMQCLEQTITLASRMRTASKGRTGRLGR